MNFKNFLMLYFSVGFFVYLFIYLFCIWWGMFTDAWFLLGMTKLPSKNPSNRASDSSQLQFRADKMGISFFIYVWSLRNPVLARAWHAALLLSSSHTLLGFFLVYRCASPSKHDLSLCSGCCSIESMKRNLAIPWGAKDSQQDSLCYADFKIIFR